jgi:hypothetical protein
MHPDGYFALLLTDESSAQLRALSALPSLLAHHCTVRHGTRDPADLPAAFAPSDVGRTFRLQVIGVATRADGGVQAAAVALVLPDGRVIEAGFSENRVPHVTIATDGVTEPVAANALLEAGFERSPGPVLTAVLLHSDAWTLAEGGAPR